MADNVAVPAVNAEEMARLGARRAAEFEQYKKDRREVEQQWLRNLRQFKGVYDPEIAARIPADQSTAYPKITRTKVIGTVARLMEMLFPMTEKNWGIRPSPLPDLSESDLQTVLDELTAPLEDGSPAPEPTTAQIEKAVSEFAKGKAERMSKEMEDQLDEIEYITLARRVVFSAVQYSMGILKGPMVKVREGRTWVKDPLTGRLTAKTVERLMPYYEPVSVWDYYPDLSAKEFEQMDGEYQRHIMSRAQLLELAKRPDFNAAAIKGWLKNNQAGNYRELDWEAELRVKADRKNLTDLAGRKYEVWEFWGAVSGHELKACGIAVPEEQLSAELQANLWGIGSTIIKSRLHPYDAKTKMYHVFVYEEDDVNLTGTGLPQVVRDSQMAICEGARMLLDNASVVTGDMLEINTELLTPGQDLSVRPRRIWLREGFGQEANVQAVRAIPLNSHMAELTGIIDLFMGFADTETALPPPALGDPSKGGSEALRTTGGMSMLMGAAALPIRDTVRNFDKFTTSFISSLYYWNMEFNPNDDIKGDYVVVARGSTSLIAKEVRAGALDQFAVTLNDEERAHVSTRKLLEERMKARDIPPDVLDDMETVERRLAEQAQRAGAQEDQQARMTDAQIKKLISAAFKDIAMAVKAQTSANTETFNAVVEGITNAADTEARSTGGAGDGVQGAERAGAAGAAIAG